MQLKGKQIKDGSVEQGKLNVTTASITEINSVTNAEYVDTNSNNRVESVSYATLNMNMTANGVTVGGLACDTPVLEFPISNIQVKVNNISVTVGENEDCYFSPDGSTIRTNNDVVKGDYLYWNSTRFDLDSDDEIDFIYLVAAEIVELAAGETVTLDPYYPAINMKYTGGDGTSMTVIIDGVSFIVGNSGGTFVWDLGGANETVITDVGDGVTQNINGEDYSIWFDGFGSLLFSIKKGKFIIKIITTSFGTNSNNQLGAGNSNDYNGAYATPLFSNIKQISGRNNKSHALLNDGTVVSYGDNNWGALGLGDNVYYPDEVKVTSFTNVKKVASGAQHGIVLFNDGTIQTFGKNNYGQLGMGNTTDYLAAIQTPSFSGVVDIGCGEEFSVLILDDGTVRTFGLNGDGQLGTGDTTHYNGVVQTPAITNARSVSCGENFALVVLNDDTVRGFGANSFGQLGMENNTYYGGQIVTPTGLTNVDKAVCEDRGGSFVLLKDKTVKGFGLNHYGQLGMNNTTDYSQAIVTLPYANVKDVSAGEYHSAILLEDGTVRTFGYNNTGQLGMGDETDYLGAVQTPPFTNVSYIKCMYRRTFIEQIS